MDSLSVSDAEKIIQMLGKIAGMQSPLIERRTAFAQAITEFLEGDIWVWVQSRINSNRNDLAAFSLIEGGCAGDTERAKLIRCAHDPDHIRLFSQLNQLSMHRTLLSQDIYPICNDAERVHLEGLYTFSGLSGSLFSTFPTADHIISGLGIHRRIDKPPFGERERFLMHLIFGQIEWIHGLECPASENESLNELTARERDTLIYLLGGHSAREIATKLSLSTHTVNDHIKSIHRRFNVASRGELLSQFIAGGVR